MTKGPKMKGPKPSPCGEQRRNIMANPKIVCGSTPAGKTDWRRNRKQEGTVYVTMDTGANFKETPRYYTSLGGILGHWDTTGATSIYYPDEKGFRTYLRSTQGVELTPELANSNKYQWHVNWMAIEG